MGVCKRKQRVEIRPTAPLPIIPWILPHGKVDLTLMDRKKDKRLTFNSYTVQDYINTYYNYVQIYTDTSKTLTEKVGVAYRIEF